MNIHILGTGSTGNSYIVSSGPQRIILDAGVPQQTIRRYASFELLPIFLTHEHTDHAKSALQLAKIGHPLILTQGTADAIRAPSEGTPIKIIRRNTHYKYQNIRFFPFHILHDCAEGCGYYIEFQNGETILYATDTARIPYAFPTPTCAMIEVNYTKDKLLQNTTDRAILENSRRVIQSHQSLETAKHYLQTWSEQPKSLIVIHMSSRNCDPEQVQQQLIPLAQQCNLAQKGDIISTERTTT